MRNDNAIPVDDATSPPGSHCTVQLGVGIASDLGDYASSVIGRVLEHRGRGSAPARVHVVRHRDPARPLPVTARAVVDLDGTVITAHAEAATPRAAVDLLVARLTRRLERMRRPAREGAHGLPGPNLRRTGELR
ncbi:HPF/RaiA family ribosome-associated protein [Pseudonocardia sp. RS010]|uniref:HPF/RaiA family ribosome-associated protein n=1 Tax=Pseudonocardia sp. RS010 TaxID=3385979 RepID=UPI0039A3D7D1